MPALQPKRTGDLSICVVCSTGPAKKCGACNALLYCSPVCAKANWKEHKPLCWKPGMEIDRNLERVERQVAILQSPACLVNLETACGRLNLRPVVINDGPRIYLIKTEPLVYSTQLYGQPGPIYQVNDWALTEYILNNIPVLESSCSSRKVRGRYVWAIEPKAGMVAPRASKARRQMNADGYIGNIAVEIEGADKLLRCKPGKVFRYPSPERLGKAGAFGSTFYEIHPCFWSQGIATQALIRVLRYAFDVLRLSHVIVNPRKGNAASIALVQRMSGHFVRLELGSSHGMGDIEMEIWRIDRAAWRAGEAGRPGGTVEEPVYDLEARCCRWCMRADSIADVDCQGCKWAFWCSIECRDCDVGWREGHLTECPRDG